MKEDGRMEKEKSEKENKKKSRIWDTSPTLRVGKKGVTGEFLDELVAQLEKRKVVKVKLPRGLSADERKQLAKHIYEKIGKRDRKIEFSGLRGNSLLFVKTP